MRLVAVCRAILGIPERLITSAIETSLDIVVVVWNVAGARPDHAV